MVFWGPNWCLFAFSTKALNIFPHECINSNSGSVLWESLGSLSYTLSHLWECVSFLNILLQGLTCFCIPHLITNLMLGCNNIHLVLMWHIVLFSLISMVFTNLVNSKFFLGLWLKSLYKHCKKHLMWKNQRHVWKHLYCKIFSMNHIMHIDDKCNIITLDLDYHSWFKALETVDLIITKTHQPWSNDLLFLVSFCYEGVHNQQSQGIPYPKNTYGCSHINTNHNKCNQCLIFHV
jgi:hypothetical protein